MFDPTSFRHPGAANPARAAGDLAPAWSQNTFVLVLVVFTLLYGTFVARTAFVHNGQVVGTLFDDSLISMRYGQHLARGAGLVWNRGEQPPVEGYTNLGWTLLMSLVLRV